tara:strand:- start:57 stop:323 length:267 start_codon:yes stop_codon:yes gene_type:complete
MIVLKTQTKTSVLKNTDDYKHLLGVCSDGLYIFNKEQTEIIDVIVDGSSKDCTVCSAPNLDSFLDAISTIKKVLLDGLNPLEVIQFEY